MLFIGINNNLIKLIIFSLWFNIRINRWVRVLFLYPPTFFDRTHPSRPIITEASPNPKIVTITKRSMMNFMGLLKAGVSRITKSIWLIKWTCSPKSTLSANSSKKSKLRLLNINQRWRKIYIGLANSRPPFLKVWVLSRRNISLITKVCKLSFVTK